MRPSATAEITLCALMLLIIVAVSGGRYFVAYQQAVEARESLTQQLLSYQQKDIDEAHTQIAALLSANQAVSDALKNEAAQRAAVEQTIAKNKAPSISSVISEWRPRVAAVDCEWPAQNNLRATKAGTGVLIPGTSSSLPQVLTSAHVITYLNTLPESCTLTFPGQQETIKVTSAQMTVSNTEYDWAKITLTNAPAYALALARTPAARCTASPAVGESVVILGYPSIGSKTDVTATEGIISGAEGSYYITSAKVEKGNSGGAAILTGQDCYLGIPTFVDAGQIESLARILDQRVIAQ